VTGDGAARDGGPDRRHIEQMMAVVGRAARPADDAALLLLTEDMALADQPSSDAEADGTDPVLSIAALLLDSRSRQPDEVRDVLRHEFRRWLETEGRSLLAETGADWRRASPKQPPF